MRQIVLEEPGRFTERHVPPPSRAPREALVRIDRVGVCGSDLHAFAGVHPAYTYPRVIGHEISATVLEVPDDACGIRAGDRCAVEPYLSCGHCRPCRLERPNCCESLRLLGVHVDGAMQGFLNVPAHLLHKSDLLSADQLALIETLGIGAHAVRRAQLARGEEALVIGAGPIGLAVVQFALSEGARVRIVEKSETRRAFAARFGAEVVAEPGEQTAAVVFDATGNAEAMSCSLAAVAPAGRLVFVGVTRERVCLDDALLHKRELTILASRNSCGQFPRIIRMIEGGRIDTEPWITHRLALADVPGAFTDLRKCCNLVKAIVEVDERDR